MADERPLSIIIFGFVLILISVVFINVAGVAKFLASSYGIENEFKIEALLGWLVPALLGFGVIRLSNFFRIATICISVFVIVWTPIMFFYLRGAFMIGEAKLPLFSKYEFIDLFLMLFSIYAIYFLNRPKIKDKFK